jgi:hypothetical protein
MTATTTFDSTKRSLLELLKDIELGKIQLPDFQRGWVWDDEHIRSLLASVSVSFPIGAVMLLETGGEGVRFKPRPVEGTDESLKSVKPERLILDGQQRLTSLFQSLCSGRPVETRDVRKTSIKRWYYVDINKALADSEDREDAIIGVPEDRVIKNFRGEVILDVSSAQREFEHGLFPVSRIRDYSDWRSNHNEFWDYAKDKIKLFDRFELEVLERFKQYQVPLIQLLKETPKEAVCLVFEKVNTGGVSLTVFELLTATFAADEFALRDDWAAREKVLKKHQVLRSMQNDDFLQVVSLLTTHKRNLEATQSGTPPDKVPGISCKRKDILRLTVDDYRSLADITTAGFVKAAKFLYQQKIFTNRDLPYRTQLVPLAAIFSHLGNAADTDGVRQKMARWYWSGVFGELYGSAIETRFAKDLPEVVAWVSGGSEPTTLADSNFAATRLLTLRTRNSAAYKGLYALLLRDGGQDFLTGVPIEAQQYFEERIDIHHVFPCAWCTKQEIARDLFDSIINKTPLSARTNQMVGGRAPSAYLETVQNKAGIDANRMNEILDSHVIAPATLRADEFKTFFEKRAHALLDRIEQATGKQVSRDQIHTFLTANIEQTNEDEEEWEDTSSSNGS